MTERLTLEIIGELAGVSRATVSRVVNDSPGVRDEVRERVLAVIQETGYQPHSAARSLASNRMDLISLVIPTSTQSLFTDPYFPRLIQGVTQSCNENNITMSLFMLHSEDEEERLYPRVLNRGYVDGVILASFDRADPLVARLEQNKMPFIMIGRPEESSNASYIDVNNEAGAYAAVTHLVRQGKTRIATITGRQDISSGKDRLAGYKRALIERGLSVDENLIVNGRFNELEAYNAMLKLLPHQPDAVFVASDGMAYGVLRALRQANISVPDEIAVVGFDDLPSSATSDPPLTTIRQPIRRMGAMAVDMLLDIINEGIDPPRRVVLPTELIVRQTCGTLNL
ncbi:MAG: LacI family DNA-binding transcriptional regulator [Anaerolineae bacterium]|nr:LacI family DNA-binding transcriptional regulator [Anaerolineae bacterium]